MGNSSTKDKARLLSKEFESQISYKALQRNHDEDSISYEGHLFIISNDDSTQKWVILKRHELLIYNHKQNLQHCEDIVNLNIYYTVRREGGLCCKHRSTVFRLIANPNRDDSPKEYLFRAPSNEERDEWIRYLRIKLPDKVGTSVNWNNQYETYCSFWFMILCVAMAFTFIFGVK